MRNRFHFSLLVCAALLVTGCGDIGDPIIASPVITPTAITSTSVSLSWTKATDGNDNAATLVYKVYLSGPNPANRSFDTLAEVEAGTLTQTLTDAGSATISAGIVAGSAYYVNIVVEDRDKNKSLYEPLGEYFHAGQVSYYPFNGNTNDVETTTPNNLIVATGLALPTVTSDRFSHAGSAYNFAPATPQCLQSNAVVGINNSAARSVSFWVQSSNTPAGTRRAAFAWGDESASGSSFGFFEAGLGSSWTVWLGTATIATTSAATSSWEHWVIGYDGTTISTYRNGASVTSAAAAVNTASTSLLHVGCGLNNVGAPINPYQGNIDDVRIFSSLLSSTEVANLYAVTRP